MLKRILIGLFFAMSLQQVSAHSDTVQVRDVVIRAMPAGMTTTAAYMVISNDSHDAKELVSVESPLAGNIEIHESVMNDGVMSMQKMDSLLLPAESKVELNPEGLHLMMLNLTQDLEEGDFHEITLMFADGSEKKAVATVQRVVPKAKHEHTGTIDKSTSTE